MDRTQPSRAAGELDAAAPSLDGTFRWLWKRETIIWRDPTGTDVFVYLAAERGPNGQDADPVLEERYRGAFATADTGNRGEIEGNDMHPGNFVMFTGNTTGIWQQNRLMQWSGNRWNMLSIELHRHLYQQAVSDITANALDGVFGAAFIRTLFLNMGTANTFNVICRLIVGSAAANIEIDGNNRRIRSGNFTQGGNAGFNLSDTGQADFNNINTRNMNAVNAGTFGSITVDLTQV